MEIALPISWVTLMFNFSELQFSYLWLGYSICLWGLWELEIAYASQLAWWPTKYIFHAWYLMRVISPFFAHLVIPAVLQAFELSSEAFLHFMIWDIADDFSLGCLLFLVKCNKCSLKKTRTYSKGKKVNLPIVSWLRVNHHYHIQ